MTLSVPWYVFDASSPTPEFPDIYKGPIAKPASRLPEVLRVQTVVNGKPEQDATTDDLIFSIPFLIETLSEGITLQPGDVIATGTVSQTSMGVPNHSTF